MLPNLHPFFTHGVARLLQGRDDIKRAKPIPRLAPVMSAVLSVSVAISYLRPGPVIFIVKD